MPATTASNLLDGDKLSIVFNEKTGANQNKLDVQGQTITAANLGIQQAGTAHAATTSTSRTTSTWTQASDVADRAP